MCGVVAFVVVVVVVVVAVVQFCHWVSTRSLRNSPGVCGLCFGVFRGYLLGISVFVVILSNVVRCVMLLAG